MKICPMVADKVCQRKLNFFVKNESNPLKWPKFILMLYKGDEILPNRVTLVMSFKRLPRAMRAAKHRR